MTVTHMYHLRADDTEGIAAYREAVEKTGSVMKIDGDCALNVAVLEAGMQSGRPSIMLWWVTDQGVIAAEMSLDQLINVQIGMEGMAKTHFGFQRA